ncbi:hypothetical protein BCR42DRAFT_416897 [Absidia repens]|uniref:DH domain-containing protein n=1 Tax=Absidia repens TaxID=90262 RepID=A0A1X2IF49_9FUNG|nr:hypothetical protein BCR42DRAFT_416897 [Absidia repens]
MNISLQFEPLDCSFYDWPSDTYAVQPINTATNTSTISSDKNDTDIVATSLRKQKQSLRCLHAIDELLHTERDYTNHLTHMVNVCFGQILQRQKWIQEKHKDTIARNANELLQFHQSLLAALEEACLDKDILTRCGHIATTFLDMGSSFTLYDTYCDRHDAAIALCNEYRSKPEWTVFIRDCATTPTFYSGPDILEQVTKPLHFEDYLIKPVQRVCRYQLLLKEILHYTPRGTAEHRRLDCALGMMQAVVAGIDRRKYHRDTTERTRLFIDRLDSSSTDGRLDKNSMYMLGNLIMAGAIDVTYSSLGHTTVSSSRSKYLGCFIFSTYLIMHWFPLRLVELEDLQDINDQRENAFVVRYKKHCFAFTATCQREKRLWLSKLSQAITTAKSQPRSADNFIVSSLHGSAKPTKLRTSRSVTNLLDFSRDSTSSSLSVSREKYADEEFTGHTSSNDISNFKRSKSLSLQLASYYNMPPSTPSSPSSPKLPPVPTNTKFPHQHHCRYTEHPHQQYAHSPTTKTVIKRHSVDFSPRSKKQEQIKSRIHSEMYIKPPDLSSNDPSSKCQRRSGSVDYMSSSSSQLSLNMIGKIKNNHQHALRIGSDHKLRDVCTQDYLSSRSWSTLLRESSNGQTHYTSNSNNGNNTNINTSGIENNNGITGSGGRRKSSLSNLRSSSSSFSMLMSPSRKVSDGGSSQSTSRSSNLIMINNGSSVDNTTSSGISSTASTIDETNVKYWKTQLHHPPSTPQPHQQDQRFSTSSVSSSTSSRQSAHLSSISKHDDHHYHQQSTPLSHHHQQQEDQKRRSSPLPYTQNSTTSSTVYSRDDSLDLQNYYHSRREDSVKEHGTKFSNIDAGGQKKKTTLRSSISTYSLHIQPMTTNVKYALRRLTPSQQNSSHLLDNKQKQQQQCDSYLCNSQPVTPHTQVMHHPIQIPSSSPSPPPPRRTNHMTKKPSRLFSWMKNEDHTPTSSSKLKNESTFSARPTVIQPRSSVTTAMIDNMTSRPTSSFSFSSTPVVHQNSHNKSAWSRKWMASRK